MKKSDFLFVSFFTLWGIEIFRHIKNMNADSDIIIPCVFAGLGCTIMYSIFGIVLGGLFLSDILIRCFNTLLPGHKLILGKTTKVIIGFWLVIFYRGIIAFV